MVAAALTPRVLILVACDEASARETENGVYTLEGVRQGASAGTFPWRWNFDLFLLLSCPRRGMYRGWVRVVHQELANTIRYEKFNALFQEDNGRVSLVVHVDNCVFPIAGGYAVEVWFKSFNGSSAQKGELLFQVHEYEE